MIGEKILCEREGCDVEFVKKTHNQRYHDDQCCKIATNRRIMQKYYAKKEQLSGKVRYCSKCSITILSRYNDGQICSACKALDEYNVNNSVANMLMSVSWQS